MKILVLAHRVPFPPNKGEKLRTYHQLEELTNQGHTISLIAPEHQKSDLSDAKGLEGQLGLSVNTCSMPNKHYRFAKALLSRRSLSEANFVTSRMQSLLIRQVNEFAPDFILVTASSLVPLITKLKVLLPSQAMPTVLTDFMDVDSNKWQQYQARSSFPMSVIYAREARLIRKQEVEAVKLSKECYLIAQAEVDLFNKDVIEANNVRVLANGLDADTFQACKTLRKPEQPRLLFTGVMDYKPNIDAVLWFVEHCWPHIITKHPNAQFVIAGMNPSSTVQKLAEDKSIVVTGFVDDIMPYFQSASVFVAPFQIARGVQNKVLQAMACELPVVTTSRGIEGIVHTQGEDVLVTDDTQLFTEHCLTLLADQQKVESIGHSARQTMLNNYAWPEVLKPLTELIASKS